MRWRPEWPFAVLSAGVWLSMGVAAVGRPAAVAATSGFLCPVTLGLGARPIAMAGLAGWTTMSVAMMLPVTLPWLRWVGLNSVRGRRLGAMCLYAAGFLAVWLVLGTAELGLATLAVDLGVGRSTQLIAALILAGVWEFSERKRVTLVRCHRTTALPPVGWRANLACASFGVQRAWNCAVGCWALMFVVVVAGGTQITLMAGFTALALSQDRTRLGWTLRPASGLALLSAALLVALFGAAA